MILYDMIFSAAKQLIISKIKKLHNIYIYVCVFCVYLLCIYKYTHIQYISWKYLHAFTCLNVLFIYIIL